MPFCYPPTTDWSAYGDQATVKNIEPRLKANAEMFAWSMLAALTAYQIGVCPDVVRPAAAACFPLGTWMEAVVDTSDTAGLPIRRIGTFVPYISGGNWYNACSCVAGGCSHDRVSEVVLPGPVGSIEQVRIDGVVQPPTSYRVDNGNRLVSLDPDRPWPIRQNMAADGDEVGSFEVTYYRGAAPNEMTNYAAGILAIEFLKASKNEKCRIPGNATTVTRGGTTIELDPDMRKALSRIPEIAAVLQIFNPHALTSAPRVLSPEMDRRPRRTTWIGA